MSTRPVVTSRPPWWIGAAVLAAAFMVAIYRGAGGLGGGAGPAPSESGTSSAPPRSGGSSTIERSPRSAQAGDGASAATAGDEATLSSAIASRSSDVWVEFEAQVTKPLPDDDESPRHQRFLVRTEAGESVLVAHNIDVADRVPVKAGQRVRLKGRFEWNDKGGVLHWTHRDATRGAPRGWIEADGRRYE